MLLITKIVPVSIVLIQTQTDEKQRTPKESVGISSDLNSSTDCNSENVNTDDPNFKLEDCTDNPLSETKTENYELDIDPSVELEKTIEPETNIEIKSNKKKSRKQSLNWDPLNPDSLRHDFSEDTVTVNLDNQSSIDVMSVHEEKNHRFFCSICNKSYIDMPHHIKKKHHKQIKTFKCKICEYQNRYYSLLEKHIKSVHEVINPFKCSICTFDAVNKTDLKKHIKEVHEEIKTFKCKFCDYECSRQTVLYGHTESVHNPTIVGNLKWGFGTTPQKSVNNLSSNAQDVLKESLGISSDTKSLTDCDSGNVNSDEAKVILEDCTNDPLSETKTENCQLDNDPSIELEKAIEQAMNIESKSIKNKSGKQSLNLDPLRYDFPEDPVNLGNQSNENGKNLEQNGKVVCKICGFITTLQDLKSHMNLKHENKCSFCESKFLFEVELEDHTETKHPGTLELNYFCSECEDGFMFESNMVKHSCKLKKIDENKSDNPTNDIQTQADEKSRNSLTKPTLEKIIEVGLVSIISHEENNDKYYEKRKQSLNLDSLRKEFPETALQKRERGAQHNTSSFSKSAKEIYEVSLGISSAVVVNFDLKEKEKTYFGKTKTSILSSCQNCNRSFVNKDQLNVHSCLGVKQGTQEIMESVSDIDPFLEHEETMNSIENDFPEVNLENQPDDRGKNVNNLENRGNLNCGICDFKTNTAKSLLKHVNMAHENEETAICAIGGFNSTKKEVVQHVKKVHTNNFICPCCEAKFPHEDQLESHIKAKHSVSDKQLSIKVENSTIKDSKTSPNVDNMSKSANPSLVVEKIKPFKCNKCDFDTSEKGNLIRHVIQTDHDGIKTFNCTLCDFEFSKQIYLNTHIESVHEGIKPFKCHSCQYEAASKYFLKRHITLAHKSKNSENNENRKTQGLDLYYLEKTFNRANMSESVKKVYEGSLGISNAVVVNMEKGTKHCDINNQGVIFQSIKVEHPTITNLKHCRSIACS